MADETSPDQDWFIERECPICRKTTTHRLRAGDLVCTECFPDMTAHGPDPAR
jgi:hypothetical protein